MEEVSLRIGDKVLKAKKELLCEYSDYFRAMFSGYYAESDKQEINIDILDPDIMRIILDYMQMGMIILSEYSRTTISEIATVANFLQISELTKQIQYVLEIQLNETNWMEIMVIAQNASYLQLERYSAAYGLYSFKSMLPDYIPTIHKLVWYLSHPYLDSQNELKVFKFGVNWLLKNFQLDDTLLVLACLDLKRVTTKTLKKIREFLSEFDNQFSDSLVLQIIDCLTELTSRDLEISELNLQENKKELCEKFSKGVWSESLCIAKDSRPRLIKYVPVVPLYTLKLRMPEFENRYLYTYEESKGFEKYLEVAEVPLWGWKVTAWGLSKLVILCGEYGKGTGIFMKDVKVYDTLKKTWTQYGVSLPPRRHAGVTTVGDLLYIVGGVGEYRIVLETAIVFDLKERSFRNIAKLPDAIQCPAVCTHNEKVYVAGRRNIYCYQTYGDRDYWEAAVDTEMRMAFLRSYNNYIYCMQSYFRSLYRFRPGVDKDVQPIATFSNLPSAMCTLDNCLMVFTYAQTDIVTVEVYKEDVAEEQPRVLPIQAEDVRINNTIDSCTLVTTMPPIDPELPQYHKQYLTGRTKS